MMNNVEAIKVYSLLALISFNSITDIFLHSPISFLASIVLIYPIASAIIIWVSNSAADPFAI
jgi:hypothetical protein